MARLLVGDFFGHLWEINPADPDDTTAPYGDLGQSVAPRIRGLTVHDDSLYAVDAGTDALYLINPDDPDDTSGDFGLVGALPSVLSVPLGIASHEGNLYVLDSTDERLFQINPTNPSDTSGDFGLVGALPSIVGAPRGMASHEGNLYIVDAGGNYLVQINLANPSDTTPPYGRVGMLPSGLNIPEAIVSHDGNLYVVDDNDDELFQVNPANPSDATPPYGEVGGVGNGSLPSGLTFPFGLASFPEEPDQPVAPTLTVLTKNSIRAVGVAPDDGGRSIISYDWQYRVVGASTWIARSDQTNLTQTFSGLTHNTNYAFQFRATNVIGDSAYSSPTATARTLANQAPNVTINTGNMTVRGGATVSLDATVTDVDDALSTLTLAWTSNGGSFTDLDEVDTNWTASNVAGDYILTLRATDTDSGTDTATVTMTVPVALEGVMSTGDLATSADLTVAARVRLDGDTTTGNLETTGSLFVDTLSLDDYTETGVEHDALALIQTAARPEVWGRDPRDARGLLLDGHTDLPDQPINAMRFRDSGSGAGSERISLHDNESDHNLRAYFDPGGAGNGLTLWIQTTEGNISFALAGQIDGGGTNFIIFNVPLEHQSFLAGIAVNQRIIFALQRPLVTLTGTLTTGSLTIAGALIVAQSVNLVGAITSGDPTTSGMLTVTPPAEANLSGSVAMGAVETTGSLDVIKQIDLTGDITTGDPLTAASLSVTPPGDVALAGSIETGHPITTASLTVTLAGDVDLTGAIETDDLATTARLTVALPGEIALAGSIATGNPATSAVLTVQAHVMLDGNIAMDGITTSGTLSVIPLELPLAGAITTGDPATAASLTVRAQVRLAGEIHTDGPATAATLTVTQPGDVALAGSIQSGDPATAATLHVAVPIALAGAIATGDAATAATLSVTTPGDVVLAGTIETGGIATMGALTVVITGNVAPTVTVATSVVIASAGDTVTLTATGMDPEGLSITYSWTSSIGGDFATPMAASTEWTPPSWPRPRLGVLTVHAQDQGGPGARQSARVMVRPVRPVSISLVRRRVTDSIFLMAHLDLLVSQWDNATRLRALIQGKLQLLNDLLLEPLRHIERQYNPDEAIGIGLDRLGDRLGLPRPRIAASAAGQFGFATDNTGFEQGPFATTNPFLVQTVPVSDLYYLPMLRARALTVRSSMTVPEIQLIVEELFNEGTAVIEDHSDLTMTLTVEEPRAQYLQIVQDTGQIPHPAGVALNVVEV